MGVGSKRFDMSTGKSNRMIGGLLKHFVRSWVRACVVLTWHHMTVFRA